LHQAASDCIPQSAVQVRIECRFRRPERVGVRECSLHLPTARRGADGGTATPGAGAGEVAEAPPLSNPGPFWTLVPGQTSSRLRVRIRPPPPRTRLHPTSTALLDAVFPKGFGPSEVE
jgi:hypothetical protein